MKAITNWSYELRLEALREIALSYRQKEPLAAVAAIAEYNRMLEAAARTPQLLSEPITEFTPKALPNAFSPSLLAKRWQCSERHIRRLIEIGELPAFRLGTLLRIKGTEVAQYEYRGREQAVTLHQPDPASETPDVPKSRKKRRPRLDTPEMRARWKMQREHGN